MREPGNYTDPVMTTSPDALRTGVPPAGPAVPPEASAWVEIDVSAIRDNVATLRERVAPALLMAVVKADGYGHGLVPAARAALAGGADWLGVAQLAEARRLRAAGITVPLLSWIHPPGADLAGAIREGIDIGIGSRGHLAGVVAGARATGRTARVHLKIDTGLGRGGTLEDFPEVVEALGAAIAEGTVELIGTFSHFAWADAPHHPTVAAQQERFGAACTELEARGIHPGVRHLANSAATVTNPGAHLDMVRPGLAIYGLSPVPDLGSPADFGLQEAMSVRARLTLVKSARAGQGVSYGHEYTTPRDTVLGLVPAGYADGIPRSAGGRGPILVRDTRYAVAGRVCMDQVMLDLGPDTDVRAGEIVTILGSAAAGEPTAQDWADAAGSINYEIVTRMGPGLPRVLVGEP